MIQLAEKDNGDQVDRFRWLVCFVEQPKKKAEMDYSVGWMQKVAYLELRKTVESSLIIPDRKLLARFVLIREEARNVMGG
ncbi:hypothetical protein IFM89_014157 [Coptis chinensis]|uniref:Uncharacterized protein n=1 Tax=Coptis chinensis TaxID=261450 RepID=A0A835HUT3_9MAGN|nr:hypothetical protein IFM89_014157 [Coptis chinensis]